VDFFKKVGAWVVARLAEPSTWAGIAAAAGAVGVSVGSHEGVAAAVVAALVAVVKSEAKA